DAMVGRVPRERSLAPWGRGQATGTWGGGRCGRGRGGGRRRGGGRDRGGTRRGRGRLGRGRGACRRGGGGRGRAAAGAGPGPGGGRWARRSQELAPRPRGWARGLGSAALGQSWRWRASPRNVGPTWQPWGPQAEPTWWDPPPTGGSGAPSPDPGSPGGW